MSEEEKKAIEYLENQDNSLKWDYGTLQAIKTALNLIEKQQKEIEIWKETENDYEHELARKDEIIEKQQKRIEKLTTTLFHYEDTLEHYEYKVFNGDVIDLEKVKELDKIGILGKKYIAEDKIRKKIKELEKESFKSVAISLKINVLKELLEE